MRTVRRVFQLSGLLLLLAILPQCTDKKSNEYVKDGLEYIEAQDFGQAERSFKQALEKNPKNAEAHYNLGGVYNYQGRYEDAEKSFQLALRYDPAHMDAHYSLGYTYEQMGNVDKAHREFTTYKRLKKRYDKFLQDEQAKQR
ncbi:tetratricopeptide repeat protein [Nitrospina watsonii]|uniref:TPR_REGION domain-containing protein n=1 Tax=Nitrospina watsonii TaxID=1323948 RepID=A0ABM9HBC5_9BACT|nr:tetratricopeptide repeat protein [Nitrospina watsonii]CAI2717450.1 TPR_REGION domain-containing protein [Nitrospina watsonii]